MEISCQELPRLIQPAGRSLQGISLAASALHESGGDDGANSHVPGIEIVEPSGSPAVEGNEHGSGPFGERLITVKDRGVLKKPIWKESQDGRKEDVTMAEEKSSSDCTHMSETPPPEFNSFKPLFSSPEASQQTRPPSPDIPSPFAYHAIAQPLPCTVLFEKTRLARMYNRLQHTLHAIDDRVWISKQNTEYFLEEIYTLPINLTLVVGKKLKSFDRHSDSAAVHYIFDSDSQPQRTARPDPIQHSLATDESSSQESDREPKPARGDCLGQWPSADIDTDSMFPDMDWCTKRAHKLLGLDPGPPHDQSNGQWALPETGTLCSMAWPLRNLLQEHMPSQLAHIFNQPLQFSRSRGSNFLLQPPHQDVNLYKGHCICPALWDVAYATFGTYPGSMVKLGPTVMQSPSRRSPAFKSSLANLEDGRDPRNNQPITGGAHQNTFCCVKHSNH
ncbi:hypothetical protein AURDEDRAFT_131541 [Auricularia subglabra TFB-10046 SS5]|uniref:Uncharacterized protein n=1 Tax=Auricularia subglabra (strain TFB-10046 / SS5) TaxID=717982 RepID=J0WPB5_AURST|nr:hypothetical protein AURDEDRAFT_131541 [Auricularia subglabra TFB-10046 SS5]